MGEQRTLGVPTLRALPLRLNAEGVLEASQVQEAVEYLRNETERWLRQLYNDVDKIVGMRGEPTFEADVNSNGHRIKSLGKSVTDTDAQTRGQCLHLDPGGTVFDSGGRALVVPIANQDNQAVPLTQLKNFDSGKVGGIDSLEFLQRDGSVALTAPWDAGSFEIRAETFESDVPTGTAPLTIASTTVVPNLNADQIDGQDYAASTFTATGTGFVVNPTATAEYILMGGIVILHFPTISGTSNAVTFTLTGVPAAIQPTNTSHFVVLATDNSVNLFGLLRLNASSSTIDLFTTPAAGGWTAANTKSLPPLVIAYGLT